MLFTRDSDLLTEASRRLRDGQPLVGLVYARQLHVTIGQCVRDLELIATVGEPDDLAGRVHHLPFRRWHSGGSDAIRANERHGTLPLGQ
ncbi:MAG: hypothetical protein A2X51_10450 [Candidatus Rokubacteria bacterium GWC2_70_24]|nr:MAG: hypothetical protein A2X53_20170 [Candidatus Rokubacteria bacterium GWA2_70_23]OGK88350.1 MAG: hypothetical protein A2X51_10450 [Candidatus Rokubacteria bacterium GWC2_70_24]HAM57590.1 hypothetical protein [Candidatus Rokubacteria bacterium]